MSSSEEVSSHCTWPHCADIHVELRALIKHFVPCRKNCESCQQWKSVISTDSWVSHLSWRRFNKRDGCTEPFHIRSFTRCLDKGKPKDPVEPCPICSDLSNKLPHGVCETFNDKDMGKKQHGLNDNLLSRVKGLIELWID